MPDPLVVLLDQNVPHVVAIWLRKRRPQWVIHHTSEVVLSGKPDEAVFAWAQERQALIITFDEDFADARSFLQTEHFGYCKAKSLADNRGGNEGGVGSVVERSTGPRINRSTGYH